MPAQQDFDLSTIRPTEPPVSVNLPAPPNMREQARYRLNEEAMLRAADAADNLKGCTLRVGIETDDHQSRLCMKGARVSGRVRF